MNFSSVQETSFKLPSETVHLPASADVSICIDIVLFIALDAASALLCPRPLYFWGIIKCPSVACLDLTLERKGLGSPKVAGWKSIIRVMHQIHTERALQYLVDSVQSVAESSRRPGLRSANTADYVKRCTRTKFGERCFSHAGPAAWNSLPASIKLTTDTNRLKKLLKAHLFHIAF